MGLFHQKLRNLSLITLFVVGASACSGGSSSRFNEKNGVTTNLTKCFLPSDQGRGSFYGQWGTRPVPLVLDKDFYVSEGGREATQIKNAVETWNRWYRVKYGSNLFYVVGDGVGQSAGRDIPNLIDRCDQVYYTSDTTDAVGIWKIRPYGNGVNRRKACTDADRTRTKLMLDLVQGSTGWTVSSGRITGASILLNFDGWNVPGRSELDIESLALHELGHVLGLLHSCNGSTEGFVDGTGATNCSGANYLYKDAVMYPSLQVGQIRRILQPNDYSRVNCLY